MADLAGDRSRRASRRSSKLRNGGYDLAVVGRLSHVTAPKQARSERTTQRALGALATLLESKRFSEISIPEIASKAKCSAAALYGRFKDKNSLLMALHESLRESMVSEIDALLDVGRWSGRSIEELTQDLCVHLAEFYQGNRNLLLAALVLGEQEVYERAASTIGHVAKCYKAALAALDPDTKQVKLQRRVDLGIRAVMALLQQRILFDPVRILETVPEGNHRRHAEELAQLLLLCVRGRKQD